MKLVVSLSRSTYQSRLKELLLRTTPFRDWLDNADLLAVEIPDEVTMRVHIKRTPHGPIRLTPRDMEQAARELSERLAKHVEYSGLESSGPDGGTLRYKISPSP